MLPPIADFFSERITSPRAIAKTNVNEEPQTRLLNWMLRLGAPLIALICYESFSRGDMGSFFTSFANKPVMFLLNYGLVACFFGLFTLLRSDRVRICCIILATALFSALGIVNYYKIHYRFEPLLLTDVFQLGEMQNSLKELPMTIHWTPCIVLGGITALALAGTILFFRSKRTRRSVLWPVFSAGLFCIWVSFCTFENPAIGIQTDLVEYSRAGGSLYTMIAMEHQRRLSLYSDYTPLAATEAYEEIKSEVLTDSRDTPNIIFILSESFTDQAHLSNALQFTDTLMPFYDQLVETCISGELYVPKMGGGTSETEFEILTSLQSKYSVTPYSVGLPELHSVAAVMRERGYKSTALHWYTGVFYNRYKNLQQLGFDEFYTTDTTNTPFSRTGRFVSDEEHYRSILETMERSEEKDFVFCITMQNHGPYDYADFSALYGATAPFANSLSDKNFLIANNYCYLLRQSDYALQNFIGELSDLEEPTLVVFFGDHIPPLGTEFYAEVDMALDGDLGHLVPYFIWSNVGNTPQQVSLQAWQLGAFALAEAGINNDPFLHYVESLRKAGIDEDERYKLLSYDALFGEQAVYKTENFSIPSSKWQIGGEMKLLGMDAVQIEDAIYIVPRLEDSSQAYKLTVNGQVTENMHIFPTGESVTLQCMLSNSRGVVYNLSPALTFASTGELLEQSGEMEKAVVSLCEEPFSITEEQRGYFLIETDRPIHASAGALTMDGKRLEWQHRYAFAKGGQFYLLHSNANEGGEPLSLTITRADFEGYQMSSEGIAKYLRDHNAQLFLLGESSESR